MEFDKYDKNGAYHIDWFRANKHGYKDHLNRVLREFTGCKAKTILDVGCGEGLLCKLLLKKGVTRRVLGIDTSFKAIELGRALYKDSCETGRMHLQQQSLVKMDGRKRFDYIVCSEVIEHVDKPDLFIKKINRMVRKWAIITTPNFEYVSPGIYDKQLFNKVGLEEMLQSIVSKYEFLALDKTIVVKIIK